MTTFTPDDNLFERIKNIQIALTKAYMTGLKQETDWKKEINETVNLWERGKYSDKEFINQIIYLRNKYGYNKK